jgi:hypothetical protein
MQRAWVAIAQPEPMKMTHTELTAMPCVEQVAMAQPELMAVARGVPMASACTAHAEPLTECGVPPACACTVHAELTATAHTEPMVMTR